MSLVFAHGRWQSEGEIDYEGEAFGLFDVMRKKEEWNGGIQGGATNTFDADTKLVFDVPNERAATYTRPALVMPAYYSLWAQATGDSFYTQAADSARAFWKLVADPDTGLVPGRAEFDGDPVQGWETFTTESYRTHFNVMLDGIWSRSAWSTEQANRVIAFFTEQGINEYVREYTLDGMPVVTERESSLTPANGALALVADIADREAFIDAVWNQPLNRFQVRYYSGTLLLLALISLSGQFRVY
jgi:oligosaccharide reducing-end xylanase